MASSKNYIKNSPTIIKKLYYGLVPFHKRYGNEFNKTYKFISETLDWDADKLKEYQLSEIIFEVTNKEEIKKKTAGRLVVEGDVPEMKKINYISVNQ